jgi:hypothetical protein
MTPDYDTVRALVRQHGDPSLMFIYDALHAHLASNGPSLLTNAGIGALCCISATTARRKVPLLVDAGLIERHPVHLGANNTPYRYALPVPVQIGERPAKLNSPLVTKKNSPLVTKLSTNLEEEEDIQTIEREGDISEQVNLAHGVGIRGDQLQEVAAYPLPIVQEAVRRTQAHATDSPAGYLMTTLKSLGAKTHNCRSKVIPVTRSQLTPPRDKYAAWYE